ncbi:MAG: OmpA family protein [Bacteroidales bacterium]|nr:OmpA family protein [Bacteroidales bacterium]
MLKRILKIGMVASVMMCSFSAFAQEEQTQKEYQYPNYSFWSNWSLGANGGMTLNLDRAGGEEIQPSWGFGLFVSKELNHVWDLRLQGNLHNVKNGMGKSASMTVGFTFSIIDAIKGYNPERAWKFYLLGSAGMGIDKSGVIVEDYGQVYYLAGAGLGLSYRFAERWTAALEANAYFPGDLGSPFDGFKGYYAYTSLGLAYNFGVTATDKARIAQEAMLTQENFDALTQERDQAKNELEVSKKSERALQEKVAALEKAQVNNEKLAKSEEELAKLRAQIDQIKKEQLTFYALPLSILYSVDEYRVPATEMKKMKAIARVMNDNPDYKFTIVGFADYTGSADYNQKLSEKRAEEAKKVLVKKYGIAEDRLIIAGKGQGDSFGDVKLPINRRVSFYRVIE